MKKFTLKIITPEKVIYDGQVREVILPTRDGQAGVLADHVPYMAPLRADELEIHLGEAIGSQPERVLSVAIDFGIAEFVDNQLTVLVAEAAKKRAQELMTQKISDATGYAQAQAALEREIAKIKVANKYRLRQAKSARTQPE